MATLLYQFMVSPYRFIQENSRYLSLPFALLALLFASSGFAASFLFHSSSFFSGDTLFSYGIGFCFSFVLFFIFLSFQAMLLDFICQFMNRSGHSLPLFFSFSISMLPLCLLLPIHLLSYNLPYKFDLPLSFIEGIVFLFCVSLQIASVRHLYRFSLLRSLLVFFFPMLLPTLLLMAFFSSVGLVALLGL